MPKNLAVVLVSFTLLPIAAVTALPIPAAAQQPPARAAPAKPTSEPEPKVLGAFDNWAASEIAERSGKACYIVARPQKSEGRYGRRGEVLLTVTHRPAAGQRNEVSVKAGYPYKPDDPPEIEIGDRKFTMFIRPDYDPEGAWTPDAAADRELVDAMARGRTLVLRGTSSRGTETVDTFSLIGFTKAYQEINKACGVK